jgi:hypothetical protein
MIEMTGSGVEEGEGGSRGRAKEGREEGRAVQTR